MSTQPTSPSYPYRPAPREPRGPVTFGQSFREAMSELSRLYAGTPEFKRKRAAFLRGYVRCAPDLRDVYADEYRQMRERQVRR